MKRRKELRLGNIRKSVVLIRTATKVCQGALVGHLMSVMLKDLLLRPVETRYGQLEKVLLVSDIIDAFPTRVHLEQFSC